MSFEVSWTPPPLSLSSTEKLNPWQLSQSLETTENKTVRIFFSVIIKLVFKKHEKIMHLCINHLVVYSIV